MSGMAKTPKALPVRDVWGFPKASEGFIVIPVTRAYSLTFKPSEPSETTDEMLTETLDIPLDA